MYSVHGKLVVTNNLDNYTKDNNIKIFPNCTVFFFLTTQATCCASGFLLQLDQVRYIHRHLLNLSIVEYFYVL